MVEFLHFDIQSTGQKSLCVSIRCGPSQSYVLIRQSDSPCSYQFFVGSCAWRCGPGAGPGGCAGAPRSAPARPPSPPAGPPQLPPYPKSQSFSQSYGSILPTSLTYICPSTRGCKPRRPAAVMGTTGREDRQGAPGCSPGFSRAVAGVPHSADARCSTSHQTVSPLNAIPRS